MNEEEEIYKICTKCHASKPLSEFHKEKKGKFGRSSECKECKKGRDKRYKKEHLKEMSEYMKLYNAEYYEANKVELNRKKKKYRSEHIKEIKEYTKRYNRKHRDKIQDTNREYRETIEGRAICTLLESGRRARKRNARGEGITKIQITYLLKQQGNKCNKCRKRFTKRRRVTIDHIISLAVGGAHDFNNIQLLCQSCNSSKHAYMDPQFIQTWNHCT